MKLFCTLLLSIISVGLFADTEAKHLFVLSGQSNMQGHRPEEAFTPIVEKALGKDRVIVVQDALGGQPIHRWWKQWKDPKGVKPNQTGDLYDRLMVKVNAVIGGQKIKTICFVWMQGERDAKMSWGKLYEKALLGLHAQLAKTDKDMAARLDIYKHRVPAELYQVDKDPDCLVNLIDHPEHQKELQRLQRNLQQWMVRTKDPILEVFQKREDKKFVEEYMLTLEAQADARKKAKNKSPKSKNKKKS